MADSFNGTGTRYYGKRDFLPDGSFITTEWLSAVWIPIIPNSSYRVQYLGREDDPNASVWLTSSTISHYNVLANVGKCWKQIKFTWAYLSAWAVLVFVIFVEFSPVLSAVGILLTPLLLMLPFFLRNFARWKINHEAHNDRRAKGL